MDTLYDFQVRCDRKAWDVEHKKLAAAREEDNYYSIFPALEILAKTIGPAPVIDHIGMAVIDQWGDRLHEALDLARRLDDLGQPMHWGPLYKTYHHASLSMTVCMKYLGLAGRSYDMAVSLTGYSETPAMIAEKAGLSRNAAMLVTERMLQLHYVPEHSLLGVATNEERGWTMRGTFDPALEYWMDELASIMEYALEAQIAIDMIVRFARQSMSKKNRANASDYVCTQQLLYAFSPKLADLENRSGMAIFPELERARRLPMFAKESRIISDVVDKLVLCKLGAKELDGIKTYVDHASVTIY